MRHSFTTSGVCSRKIDFDLDGNVVKIIEEGVAKMLAAESEAASSEE